VIAAFGAAAAGVLGGLLPVATKLPPEAAERVPAATQAAGLKTGAGPVGPGWAPPAPPAEVRGRLWPITYGLHVQTAARASRRPLEVKQVTPAAHEVCSEETSGTHGAFFFSGMRMGGPLYFPAGPRRQPTVLAKNRGGNSCKSWRDPPYSANHNNRGDGPRSSGVRRLADPAVEQQANTCRPNTGLQGGDEFFFQWGIDHGRPAGESHGCGFSPSAALVLRAGSRIYT